MGDWAPKGGHPDRGRPAVPSSFSGSQVCLLVSLLVKLKA
jgi:hypothetical protein